MPPLTLEQVDADTPFLDDELLYRRIAVDELNSQGEVDATRIGGIRFNQDVQSSPSVMRSQFCTPTDVLDQLCTQRDVSNWSVFSLRVADLPQNLLSGDKRLFNTFAHHSPELTCGAHSVIACSAAESDPPVHIQPSVAVINQIKVELANRLRKVDL